MTPALFISHGSPMAALSEDAYARQLAALGEVKPAAVVVLSAHGLSAPDEIILGAADKPGIIHDFGGFPEALHRFSYSPPGEPALAREAARLLPAAGLSVRLDPRTKLDHGVWVPLSRMYPGADVPVVQVSLPYPAKPERVLAMGGALAPLRRKNVLILGSGGAVHNLAELSGGAAADWARKFHAWVKSRVEKNAVEELLDYERLAPEAGRAHPSPDHFLPIFFTLGAALAGDRPRTLIDEIQLGSLSLYSFALAGA